MKTEGPIVGLSIFLFKKRRLKRYFDSESVFSNKSANSNWKMHLS